MVTAGQAVAPPREGGSPGSAESHPRGATPSPRPRPGLPTGPAALLESLYANEAPLAAAALTALGRGAGGAGGLRGSTLHGNKAEGSFETHSPAAARLPGQSLTSTVAPGGRRPGQGPRGAGSGAARRRPGPSPSGPRSGHGLPGGAPGGGPEPRGPA